MEESEKRIGKIRLQRIPYALPPVPRTKLSLFGEEFLFLLINLTLAGYEVDLVERDDFGFVLEFVSGPEDEEGGDSDVGGDERIGLEGDEGVITLEEGDDGGSYEGEICAPWLEWSLVGQVVTGVALNLESLHESTMGGTLANGFLA